MFTRYDVINLAKRIIRRMPRLDKLDEAMEEHDVRKAVAIIIEDTYCYEYIHK